MIRNFMWLVIEIKKWLSKYLRIIYKALFFIRNLTKQFLTPFIYRNQFTWFKDPKFKIEDSSSEEEEM